MIGYLRNIFIPFLFIATINSYSQFTETGQDPSSVSWRQINTEKFRLVYDSCFEKEAQRIASIIDYSSQLTGNTLHQGHKKIPILIHNHSVISNGSVTLVPKRMEFFIVPPQDMDAQGWFELLAIHEGRHWSQMNRFDRGTISALRILFGESLWGASAGQAHMWFLEGDAVTTETALTKAGRGRLPSFEMGIRAHIIETHNPYSFRKSVFGSFNDYVPNHYELGYLMVAYNRVKYGPQLWENMLDNIGQMPIITPSLSAIKWQTGKNRKALYNQTFHDLDSLWTLKSKEINYSTFQPINHPKTKSYASYRSPLVVGNKIIALKSGMDDITRIVSIDRISGIEHILCTPGVMLSERITTDGKKIYWDENVQDIRWEYRDYSVVKCCDLSTGNIVSITKKSRYFAPSPSPDGSMIAVLETNTIGENSIVIIDAASGKAMSRHSSLANAAIQFPSWNESGDKLVATLVDTAGKSLVMLDVKNNTWETILPAGSFNISQPRINGKYIYFNASYSGIDNIYAVDINSKNIFEVTSAKYGAFDPMVLPKGDSILYSNYMANGYKLAITSVDTTNWVALRNVKNNSLDLVQQISSQEPLKFNSSEIKNVQYESKPYRKISHLINIHSWVPFYFYQSKNSFNSSRPMLGYYVMSQNLLGTFSAIAGQGFYKGSLYNELTLAWKGWFPVIEAGIQQGDTIGFANQLKKYVINGKNLQFYSTFTLPLNLSRGSNLTGFSPSYTYSYENTYFEGPDSSVYKGTNNSIFAFSFHHFEKPSIRDITPNNGISVNFMYHLPLTNINLFSPQTLISGNIYFPGIMPHHSIMLTVAHENQKLKYFFEKNRLESPRGYLIQWDTSQPTIKKMSRLAFDYMFPIVYPDITVLKVIYLKRISASLYGEINMANVYSNQAFVDQYFSSAGFELLSYFNLFFIPMPFELGIRYSYRFKDKEPAVEFPILKINLGGFK
jgi:Tol biopolymer transport system component